MTPSAGGGGGGGGGGGNDNTPDAVNWANISYGGAAFCGTPYAGNAPQQITGISSSITLRIEVVIQASSTPQSWNFYYRKSTSSFSAITGSCSSSGFPGDASFSQYTAFTSYAAGGAAGTITVNSGDYLAFVWDGTANEAQTVTVRNMSDTGTPVLDTFTVNVDVAACYLTSVVVAYMGLSDDGPELTAMRALRSHYMDVPGYDQILAEYAQFSAQIISAIEAANSKSIEYGYIYNTVVAVMGHVNAGEWQQAHDLYMAMYEDLKARYLGV